MHEEKVNWCQWKNDVTTELEKGKKGEDGKLEAFLIIKEMGKVAEGNPN